MKQPNNSEPSAAELAEAAANEEMRRITREYRRLASTPEGRRYIKKTRAELAKRPLGRIRNYHDKGNSDWVRRGYSKVRVAKRNGSLVKQPCVKCGNQKVEAHHEDYGKPLDVIWFCKKHHCERHKELGWGTRGIKAKV